MVTTHYAHVTDVPPQDLRTGDQIIERQRDGLFTVWRPSVTLEVPC